MEANATYEIRNGCDPQLARARRTRRAGRALGALGALALIVLLAGAGLGGCSRGSASSPTIHVYKTPTCGCCTKWIEHLEAAGFSVEHEDLQDLSELKREQGVPTELASCHTALVDGYVLEGHVPASDVTRLLSERPSVRGLAVPEMPLGSPGMEQPDPARHEAFDVLSFGAEGVRVFQSHPAAS